MGKIQSEFKEFFIWGAGQWRALSSNGRVAGWRGRARFVSASRGRLKILSSRRVLAALAEYVSGNPSAIQIGAPLPHRKLAKKKSRKLENQCHHYHHCCGELRHRCKSKTQYAKPLCNKSDVSIQVDGIPESPRQVRGSSEDTLIIRPQTSTQTERVTRSTSTDPIQSIPKSLTKTQDKSIETEPTQSIETEPTQSIETEPTQPIVAKTKSKKINEEKKVENKKGSVKKIGAKRISCDIDAFAFPRVRPKRYYLSSESDRSFSVEENSEESEIPWKRRAGKRVTRQSKVRNKVVEISESSSNESEASTKLDSESKSVRRISDSSSQSKNSDYIELTIDEADVEVLRRFLVCSTLLGKFSLQSFDQNEEYKREIFLKINPYVILERCQIIKSMLENKTEKNAEALPLERYANKLGLQSVSGSDKSVQPYRTRSTKKVKSNNKYKDDSDISSHVDKENVSNTKPAVKTSSKELSKSQKEMEKPLKEREQESVLVSNSEEEFEKKTSKAVKKVAKKVKPLWASGRGKGTGREYSRLEDEAIVKWVSAGRERRVNGNTIWRELEETYPNIVGHYRSWHSLRNRYLRHVLPALGALELPPPAAARLRAAAATGEIKSRSRPRRHSLYEAGGDGAWARRPRSPHNVTDIQSTENSKRDRDEKNKSNLLRKEKTRDENNRAHSKKENSKTSKEERSRDVDRSRERDDSRSLRKKNESERSKKSLLRSSDDEYTPMKSNSPPASYSELTRRFALRHRSTPASPAGSPELRRSQRTAGEHSDKETPHGLSSDGLRELYGLRGQRTSLVLAAEAERSAKRRNSPEKPSPNENNPTEGKRSRKLFNPNSVA